jgi:hypothetical protein
VKLCRELAVVLPDVASPVTTATAVFTPSPPNMSEALTE